MKRETATHQADLPHEFEIDTLRAVCLVCGDPAYGPLHTVATAHEQAAATGQLNTGLARELGS